MAFQNAEQNGCTSGSESEGRLRTSQSAPVTGLNTLGSTVTSRLPRAQNPTVTLLQKARGEYLFYYKTVNKLKLIMVDIKRNYADPKFYN